MREEKGRGRWQSKRVKRRRKIKRPLVKKKTPIGLQGDVPLEEFPGSTGIHENTGVRTGF